jgi:hypothetical protein
VAYLALCDAQHQDQGQGQGIKRPAPCVVQRAHAQYSEYARQPFLGSSGPNLLLALLAADLIIDLLTPY